MLHRRRKCQDTQKASLFQVSWVALCRPTCVFERSTCSCQSSRVLLWYFWELHCILASSLVLSLLYKSWTEAKRYWNYSGSLSPLRLFCLFFFFSFFKIFSATVRQALPGAGKYFVYISSVISRKLWGSVSFNNKQQQFAGLQKL